MVQGERGITWYKGREELLGTRGITRDYSGRFDRGITWYKGKDVLLGTKGITRDYSGGRFLGVLQSCMSVSVTREPNMLQGTTLG